MVEPAREAEEAADRLSLRATAHAELLGKLAAGQAESLSRAADLVARALDGGGTAFLFGNGGSSADAQHIVAELVGRFRGERRPLAAVALGTNPAVTTALANDYGFDEAGFARELEALGGPADVAVAISTSGRSPSVLTALVRAGEMGMARIALTGEDHQLDGLAEEIVAVGSTDVALIQEMHAVIGHLLCELVEGRLAPT